MTSKSSKLIAIVLAAIVLAAGVGCWLLAPRGPTEVVGYTTQQA